MPTQNDGGDKITSNSNNNRIHKANTISSLSNIGKTITLTARALVNSSDLHNTILSPDGPYNKVMTSTLKQSNEKKFYPNNVNIVKNIASVNPQDITQSSNKYFKNSLISERKTFQLLSYINDYLLKDLDYDGKTTIATTATTTSKNKQVVAVGNHTQQMPNDFLLPSLYQGFQTLSLSNEKDSDIHDRKLLSNNCNSYDNCNSQTDIIDKSKSSTFLKDLELKMKNQLTKYEIKKNIIISEIRDIDQRIDILKFRRNLLFNNIASLEEKEINIENDLSLIKNRMATLHDINDQISLEKGNGTSHNDTTLDTLMDYNSSVTSSTTVSDNRNSTFSNDTTNATLPSVELHNSTKKDIIVTEFLEYDDIHSSDNLIKFFQEKNKIHNKILPTLQQYFDPGSEISSFVNVHNSPISSFQFDLPFGHLFSSPNDNPEIKIWDLSKDIQIGELKGHHDTVYCMELDKSYNMLVTGSKDSTIKMWDLNKSVHTFNKHSEPNTNLCVYSFDEHMDSVTNVSINSHYLVSGSQDSTIRQWDLHSGKCIRILDLISNDSINLFSQSPKSVSNYPESIRTVNNNEVPKIGGLQSYDVALATGTSDGIVRLWDLRSGEIVRSLIGHADCISCLKFDLQNIVTGSLDKTVRVWDLRIGSAVQVFEYSSPILSLDFDSKNIAVSDGSSQVHIFDRIKSKYWDCGDIDSLNANVNFIQYNDNYLLGSLSNGSIHAWAI